MTQAEYARCRGDIQDRFNAAHVAATSKRRAVVAPAERLCEIELVRADREYKKARAELERIRNAA